MSDDGAANEAIERLVATEQIHDLYAKGSLPFVVSAVNGVIIAVALNGFTCASRVGWLAAIGAIAAARMALLRVHRRRPPPSTTARWGTLFTLGAFCNGVAWGMVAVVFPTAGNPNLHALLSFVLGGLIAGATATISSYQPAFRAFAIPAALPMILIMLTGGKRIEVAMGVMLTVFVVSMDLLARSAGRSFQQSTRLRLRNTQLLRRLAEAHDQLEQRVRERTAALEATLEEQRRAENQAQEAVRARDQFLAVASHELLTPLSALQIHMHILELEIDRLDRAASERLRRVLPTFTRQIGRLTALVDTVFRVAGLDTKQIVLDRRDIDLAALVRTAVADMEANGNMNPHGSTLSLDLHEPLRGQWDPVRVEQIIINLMSNAFKYGAGKPIRISLGEDPADPSRVILTVTDHGSGIAPADLERIFQKFHRSSDTRGQRGLGLGLFVVRQLTTAMEGTISVESTVGSGTTFSVSLPQVRA